MYGNYEIFSTFILFNDNLDFLRYKLHWLIQVMSSACCTSSATYNTITNKCCIFLAQYWWQVLLKIVRYCNTQMWVIKNKYSSDLQKYKNTSWFFTFTEHFPPTPIFSYLLQTHTSLRLWALRPSVAVAQVNWSPALVFLMGNAETNSGGGLRSADIAVCDQELINIWDASLQNVKSVVSIII